MRTTIVAAVLVALLAGACSSDDLSGSGDGPGARPSPTPIDLGTDIQLIAALTPFDACDAFLDHVHTEAGARVGPWGLQVGGYYGGPVFFEGDVATDDAGGFDGAGGDDGATGGAEEPQSAPGRGESTGDSTTSSGDGGDGSFSGTNVQVTGVDEPDIVKTDGERIVTLSDNTLTVVDAATRTVIGSENLGSDFWGAEMFLAGDRAFVVGGGNDVFPTEPFFDAPAVAEEGAASDSIAPGPGYWIPTTVIAEVDISGDPDVVATLSIEGNYVSGRATDGTARIVITSPPLELPFVYPSNQGSESFAEQANRDIVEASTVDVWVPDYRLVGPDGRVSEGQLVDCDRISAPGEFSGFDLLSVLTFDMDAPLTPGDATGVLASGETVYSSGDSLYVATTRWYDPAVAENGGITEPQFDDYTTALHRFSTVGTSAADYVASGVVDGHLLNQFSLHQNADTLYVATTEGAPWGFDDSSESFVTSFQLSGDELVPVGRVGDMGRGERIFAVRFIEDSAYVVTFRQVDPLYVVDLSDPTTPTVTGELKIPGYSAYLHPIGDGLILGVGQDATDEGFTTGAKISLFDVSDPTAPAELDTWTMPDGYTDVEWDHRAFLWWDGSAVVPLTSWSDGFAGAVVLDISRDGGITERGRVDHTPDGGSEPVSQCRPIPVDGVEEYFGQASIEACGPDEDPARPGVYCDDYGDSGILEELRYIAEEIGIDVDSLDIADDERIAVCWPEGPRVDPIQRSLVIDGALWTMSWDTLQADDFVTLSRIARLGI
ncbi:MAG: beta-propeller domain-containing protein [Acidimicrobiales bacterium]